MAERRSCGAIRAMLLAEIADDNVTYRLRGATGKVIRLWSSEKDSRTLTASERAHLKWLIACGYVKESQGWRWDVGCFVVTPLGKPLLRTEPAR